MINHHYRGFTFLEILVSSLIFSIILTTVLQLYLSLEHIHQLQTDLDNIANNGSYISYLLHQKLKNSHNVVYGFDSEHTPIHLQNVHLVKQSDVLLVKSVSSEVFLYVANTLRVNEKQQPIYSLYEKVIASTGTQTLELAEGVEKMQINFGISDTVGQNIINYINATQINYENVNKIKSLEIKLNLCSVDNIIHKPLNVYINMRN